MKVSIIVPTYQDKNINKLLQRLLEQKIDLEKIIVVACGYKDFPFLKDEKITVIEEKERRGKAFAINTGLKNVDSEIVVVVSGDVLPKKDTIKNLLNHFQTQE